MRQIYIVDATQVVASETHPEGVYSVLSGYPKTFDSRNYNGDTSRALEVAQAEFYTRVAANLTGGNRAMWTVTLTRADGRQIMRETRGAFPVTEPEPIEEEPAEE